MSRENEPDFGDAQDEIRWLRDGISAERKRLADALELAQRQDEAHMEARAALFARAEQAERERDAEGQALGEAKQQLRHLRASHKEQCDARERAEADNAEMLRRAQELYEDDAVLLDWQNAARYVVQPEVPHPGAALLERMRALESIARQIIEHWETKPRAGMAYIVMEARMAMEGKP